MRLDSRVRVRSSFLSRVFRRSSVALTLLLCLVTPATAQLDESCTATLLNRSAQVDTDGSFFLAEVPGELGLHRVRVHCTPADGSLVQGQSGLFQLIPDGTVLVDAIDFESFTPIPEALQVEVEPAVLRSPGARADVTVTGILPGGELVDMSSPAGGTEYWVSDPRLAELVSGGETAVALKALQRGRVLVGARRDGLMTAVEVDLDIPNDADGDGMSDEFEEVLGLDPNDPGDAFDDPDGDNLSNLREFELGSDIYSPDTDADGLEDGREVELGTLPNDPDSDRDGLDDGRELARGTDPLAADSDLDGLADGLEVEIGTDPLIPNATGALSGEVRDDFDGLIEGASVVVLGRLLTTTDVTGRFFLDPVPADLGPLTVFARALRFGDGLFDVLDGQSAPIALTPGQVTDAGIVRVRPMAGRLAGVVEDPRGVPVPDARVVLDLGLEQRPAATDATGVFLFERVPPGTFDLEATDPRTGLRGRAMGSLAADEDALVEIRLGAFGSVAGQVLGRDGETPAAGAVVELRTTPDGAVLEVAVSDREGRYRFDFLPLGTWVLDARDDEGNRGRAGVLIEETSQLVEADVVFLGRGMVTGQVRGESGLAIAGASVTLTGTGLFPQQLSTFAGPDGRFELVGVFAGRFSLKAQHPASSQGAIGSGEIRNEGDVEDVVLVVRETGSIEGRVLSPDGVTPVAGARVDLRGAARTLSDATGTFRFDDLPLRSWDLRARHPDSADCATGSLRLEVPFETRSVELVMNDLGTVRARVRYADGTPAAGARVSLAGGSPCSTSRAFPADGEGRVTFADFPTGGLSLVAASPVGDLEGQVGSTLLAGETLDLVVDLEAAGAIFGTVFAPDGTTPARGVEVTWSGRVTRTDTEGGFRFDPVKLSGNPHTLRARTLDGARRAEIGGIVVPGDGVAVRADLVLSAAGSVTGTVRREDGSPIAGASVTVTSSGRGPARQVLADVEGRYRADEVAAGTVFVQVLAGDAVGTGRAELLFEDDVAVVDVELLAPESRLASRLWDANNHVYPISVTSGGILRGSLGIFDGDDEENRDAMRLEIAGGGLFQTFEAAASSVSPSGRGIVEVGSHPSGLEIARKIFVPLDGYFARYLEVLSNPTAEPIAVDVRVTSFFELLTNVRDGASFFDPLNLVTTSSGDTALLVGAATPDGEEADRWLVLDAISQSANGPVFDALYPTFGYLFQGPGAELATDRVRYEVDFAGSFSRLESAWDRVTVLPGATVTLMHFAVQQTSLEAAVASQERLSALPPESLEELTALDLQTIVNFDLPPDGISLLEPLPPLDGRVRGTVFEGDGTTSVSDPEVRYRSEHPLFGRLLELRGDGQGDYVVNASAAVNDGRRVVVPRAPFTVDATHRSTRVVSPSYPGDFAGGGQDAVRDIIFVDSSAIEGTVRRFTGNVVSFGDVVLRAREQPINVQRPIAVDGRFLFNGLPPEVYSLVAVEPHPQGTGLRTAGSAAVTGGGQRVLADLTFPPTGGVQGKVTTGDAFPGVEIDVQLRGVDFARFTSSDTGGLYRFLDVPVGSYVLRVVEPLTGIATEVPMTVGEGQILTRDLQLFGLGRVVVEATIADGRPAAGAEVRLATAVVGGGFLFAGRTGEDGVLRLDDVPVGAFSVRVSHPENVLIESEASAVLAEGGGEVTVAVELPVDEPPAIELVLPVAGTMVPQGELLLIQAAADDQVGVSRVDFFVNNSLVGSRQGTPFAFFYRVLEAPATQLLVEAVVVDNGGNVAAAVPVTVTVGTDIVAPEVSITAPEQTTEGVAVSVTASATDAQGVERVEFRAGGALLSVDTEAPYGTTYTPAPDLAPQAPVQVELVATAFDFAGNSRSASRALTVVGDQLPSLALVDVPADGTVFTEGEVVGFEASASDDVGVAVELVVDGAVAQRRPRAPYLFRFTVPSPQELPSPFEVFLRARDTQGQVVASPAITLAIALDELPEVTFLAPADGTPVFEGSTVTLEASASDDLGVASVAFFLNGAPLAELTEPPYATTFQVPAGEPSDLVVSAVATDTSGQSAGVEITLARRDDEAPPTLRLTAPVDGEVLTAGPSDLVLLLDQTFSNRSLAGFDLDGDGLADREGDAQQSAAAAFLELLDPANSRVAVVTVGDDAEIEVSLTNDFLAVFDGLFAPRFLQGEADYGAGLAAAREALSAPTARQNAKPVIVLFSDGAAGEPPAGELVRLAGHDVTVHTVAVGVSSDETALAALAEATGGTTGRLAAAEDLPSVLSAIGRLGLEQLTLEAEADDDVALRDVTFRVTGALLDETLVIDEPPYLTTVPLPSFGAPVDVDVVATATDFGGNPVSTPVSTVTVRPVDSRPGLFALQPGGGVAGDRVTLLGRYFSNLPVAHTVLFDGIPAQVVSASKLALEVIVPLGVRTGPVTITLEGRTTEALTFRLDTDRDGLSDEDEAVVGSDPLEPDTDGDGLLDGAEVEEHATDPLSADTDGDGMADGFEADTGLDPLDPSDAPLDPDGDGLTNLEEAGAGSDPFDADTDGDGLPDADEVLIWGTDPALADSDGGGRLDPQELEDGTDPLDPSDDVVDLPVFLDDGDGFLWDVFRNGEIRGGLNGAFRTAFTAFVNGRGTCCATRANPEDGGRELRLERQLVAFDDELFLTRKIFVPEDDAFVRYLEILDNTGTVPRDVEVNLRTRVGTGFLTQRVATSTGLSEFNVRDLFLVTDDEDQSGSPAVSLVFAGASRRLLPSRVSTTAPGGDEVEFTYWLRVPPGERRIVMHFAVQAIGQVRAIERALALTALEGRALAGLSPAEQAEIVNFFAFPDADLDRLSDADEAALGSDPQDPDSDGDGLEDGFEVEFGFDPLTAGDPGEDPDGDGLSNFDEQSALSDPFDPDSDGDGLDDGEEVLHGSEASLPDSDSDGLEDGPEVELFGTDPTRADSDGGGLGDGAEVEQGTDPLDPVDDVIRVDLPHVLLDGEGFAWDVGGDFTILDGTADAFDKAFQPFFNGTGLPGSLWDRVDAEDLGRELVSPEIRFETSPVRWTRKAYVPPDDGFVRYLEIFERVSEPFTLQVVTRVGSREETQIVATSSGDTVFDAGDRWIVTDDLDGFGSPAVAHVFAAPNGLLAPSAVSTTAPGSNLVTFTYEVPPLGRVVLMHFGVQASDRATALATAERLMRVGGGALDSLSADERAEILNFFPFPDADFDRMSDADEAAVGTDPANPDSDGDGLSDGFEFDNGLDPLRFDVDEDGDGLENLDEIARGTNPALADTDGDLLLDGEEVLLTFTDPLVPDSDAGSVEDGREVLFDGTDPFDSGDDRGVVQVNDSFGGDDPAAAAGAAGLHVVWVDDRAGCPELFYSLLSPDGAPLIDDTQLTAECRLPFDPLVSVPSRLAIDTLGRVHAVWADFDEVRHLVLDPSLDDRDGSVADAATLVVTPPGTLMLRPPAEVGNCLPPVQRPGALKFVPDDPLRFALAAGPEGRLHLVWQVEQLDCDDPFGSPNELHYLALDTQTLEVVAERRIFQTFHEPIEARGFPDLGLDLNGGVHLVWRALDTSTFEPALLYAQLDATSGTLRVAPTRIAPLANDVRYPTLGVDAVGRRVTIAFQARTDLGPEVFLLVLDPTLDDRDGDVADGGLITVLGPRRLSSDDGIPSEVPAARVDPLGLVHLVTIEALPGAATLDRSVELTLYDGSGESLLRRLPAGDPAAFTFQAPRVEPLLSGASPALIWPQDGRILVRPFHPDGDGDGLVHGLELATGTDPALADSDGDGLGDGFELVHGFDPASPGDGTADPDDDALDNAGEESAGSDPRAPDTDGDGLDDGDEVLVVGSDPLRLDSDGDGLRDTDEVLVHGTDPTTADTDGGGRSDGEEVLVDLTNPLDPVDDLP